MVNYIFIFAIFASALTLSSSTTEAFIPKYWVSEQTKQQRQQQQEQQQQQRRQQQSRLQQQLAQQEHELGNSKQRLVRGRKLIQIEVEPVHLQIAPGSETIFEEKASDTIRKIKQVAVSNDSKLSGETNPCTTLIQKSGLILPGKESPQLREIRQERTSDGELSFTLVWKSSDTPFQMWVDERRIEKYEAFFGEGGGGGTVTVEVVKIDAEQRLVGIKLTTTSI